MGSRSIKLFPETVRSIAFGSVGAAYMGIGGAITKPIRILWLQNLTDAAIMVSWDGVNDHMPFAVNGFLTLDITANKTREDGFFIAEGQRLYAKWLGAAGTVGSVYLSTLFGEE